MLRGPDVTANAIVYKLAIARNQPPYFSTHRKAALSSFPCRLSTMSLGVDSNQRWCPQRPLGSSLDGAMLALKETSIDSACLTSDLEGRPSFHALVPFQRYPRHSPDRQPRQCHTPRPQNAKGAHYFLKCAAFGCMEPSTTRKRSNGVWRIRCAAWFSLRLNWK